MPRAEILRSLGFFLLTAASVFLTGAAQPPAPGDPQIFGLNAVAGLKLAVALFAILGSHEMGHYLACRYYRVDASLPYFIPFPSFSGTLGAFIRIRGPIPHRRALFDIGIAGPLAGFVVCLPVLVLGVLEAHWAPLSGSGDFIEFGDPLLFRWAVTALRGSGPDGQSLVIGPLGLAAWFGLFVTALNMMPVGQLDGGHVTYSLWPRWAHRISRLGLVACAGLLYLRPTWLLWTLLLLVLGRRPHFPTLNDALPVGRDRLAVGLLGFAIFAVCFTPSPVIVSWSDFLQAFGF